MNGFAQGVEMSVPLRLFSDMVGSSSSLVNVTMRGCYREG